MTDVERNWIDFAGMMTMIPAPHLIKGVLYEGSNAVLFSAANVGKTFVALDLGFHVAEGLPWRGFPVARAPVLYIVGEGLGGMPKRLIAGWQAWTTQHPGLIPSAIQMVFYRKSVQFSSETAQRQFRDDFGGIARDCGAAPRLVIIDTLATCNAGNDENTVEKMTLFLKGLRDAVGERACVLLLHHEGWEGGRMRGSTALHGNVDTELRLTPKDTPELVTMSCTKARDEERFEPIELRLRRVLVKLPQLGVPLVDDDEDPLGASATTSCIVEDAPPSTYKLHESWLAALRALAAVPAGLKWTEWHRQTPLSPGTMDRFIKYAERHHLIVRTDKRFLVTAAGAQMLAEPAKKEPNGAS